jgi:hypothetical protein
VPHLRELLHVPHAHSLGVNDDAIGLDTEVEAHLQEAVVLLLAGDHKRSDELRVAGAFQHGVEGECLLAPVGWAGGVRSGCQNHLKPDGSNM